MKKYAVILKAEGETPLECLERHRKDAGTPKDTPIAYAGRLDPMAEGKLLLLFGDECKNQRQYHTLDKTYDFEVLFGFTSDTGDILGMPTQGLAPDVSDDTILAATQRMPTRILLPYPRFSSKTVKGKPLFLWTLEGRLGEITLPTFNARIFTLTYRGSETVDASGLLQSIGTRIDRVTPVTDDSKRLGADFRRVDILNAWRETLKGKTDTFTVAKFSVTCSSGTYIRSLAPYIAEALGASGLAHRIKRTQMGKFLPFPFLKSGGIWLRSYK